MCHFCHMENNAKSDNLPLRLFSLLYLHLFSLPFNRHFDICFMFYRCFVLFIPFFHDHLCRVTNRFLSSSPASSSSPLSTSPQSALFLKLIVLSFSLFGDVKGKVGKKQGRIHGSISRERWAGALMEVRLLFGWNSTVKKNA